VRVTALPRPHGLDFVAMYIQFNVAQPEISHLIDCNFIYRMLYKDI